MPLYLIIERFRDGNPDAVGARFRERGRLMPPGVRYIDSWITPDGAACYQINHADTRAELDQWIANWSDLVDFEVAEVVPSADYWSARAAAT